VRLSRLPELMEELVVSNQPRKSKKTRLHAATDPFVRSTRRSEPEKVPVNTIRYAGAALPLTKSGWAQPQDKSGTSTLGVVGEASCTRA